MNWSFIVNVAMWVGLAYFVVRNHYLKTELRGYQQREAAAEALEKRLQSGEPPPPVWTHDFSPAADISAAELGDFIANYLTWRPHMKADWEAVVAAVTKAAASSLWRESVKDTRLGRHFVKSSTPR